MAGTLVISREVKNHAHFKKRFETLGFSNVTLTTAENDGLHLLIREKKPDQIIMGARFYECSTPYRMKELRDQFPKIYMAAVCIGYYPAELGRTFITNKINAYLTSFDGVDQFHEGLEEIRKGKKYVSPAAQEELDKRREIPDPAGNITDRHKEVILLMCNGFKDTEIAQTLYISRRTVATHKTQIFTSLNVRSPNELIRVALMLGIVKQSGLYFYPKDFVINPLPDEKILRRGKL